MAIQKVKPYNFIRPMLGGDNAPYMTRFQSPSNGAPSVVKPSAPSQVQTDPPKSPVQKAMERTGWVPTLGDSSKSANGSNGGADNISPGIFNQEDAQKALETEKKKSEQKVEKQEQNAQDETDGSNGTKQIWNDDNDPTGMRALAADQQASDEDYLNRWSSLVLPEAEIERRTRRATAINGIQHLGNLLSSFGNLYYTRGGAPSQQAAKVDDGGISEWRDKQMENLRKYLDMRKQNVGNQLDRAFKINQAEMSWRQGQARIAEYEAQAKRYEEDANRIAQQAEVYKKRAAEIQAEIDRGDETHAKELEKLDQQIAESKSREDTNRSRAAYYKDLGEKAKSDAAANQVRAVAAAEKDTRLGKAATQRASDNKRNVDSQIEKRNRNGNKSQSKKAEEKKKKTLFEE